MKSKRPERALLCLELGGFAVFVVVVFLALFMLA